MAVYVTGDTHGDWMGRLNSDAFPEGLELTKDDYVLVLGDFGIWDNSNREKYNLDWLEKKPWTTLFLNRYTYRIFSIRFLFLNGMEGKCILSDLL